MYKVMIVDDESLALEQMVSAVDWELFDFEVYAIFDDSVSAMECLKNEHVDLVITDIRMPVVTGLDIAQYCYENLPDTLVAFISSYDSFEYARQAIRYNILDYILKPFTYSQLIELLDHAGVMLDNKHSESFTSDEEQMQREKFFSDLFFGSIKSEVALGERLELIGLPPELADAPAQLITLTVNDFDKYLKTTWKYGKERFYTAVSNITFSNTEDVMFCTMMHSYNHIRIIAILKNHNENLDVLVRKYCERVSGDLAELLVLDTATIEVSKAFSSLGSIVHSDVVSQISQPDDNEHIRTEITKYLSENYLRDVSLADLAHHMCYNKVYFCSLYRKYMDENFTTTLNRMRVEKAKELLKNPANKASQIYANIGYNSAAYFYRIFKAFTGKTPADYQSEMNSKK